MKYTFLDLEYSNFSNKSICEISLIVIDDQKNKPQVNKYLVNPNDKFDSGCISMHGIDFSKVKSKPTFKEIWPKIENYFTNSVIVGHNIATSDLDGLYKNLVRYNIQVPEIYYICTYDLAKQLIPRNVLKDYSLNSLYFYYNINIENNNDSLEKLYDYYKLSEKIISNFKNNIEDCINRFEPVQFIKTIDFHTNVSLKKDIHTLYGMIEGFLLDEKIDFEEVMYLYEWRHKYEKYKSYDDIRNIIECINEITKDNIVTLDEMIKIKDITRRYLDVMSTSAITLATQILNGIISGISSDDQINIDECMALKRWMYENSYLIGHYPFDKIFSLIEQILHDEYISEEEEKILLSEIDKLLNPIKELKDKIYSFEGKKIFITGQFVYGTTKEVETALKEQGYLVTTNKKEADVVYYGGYAEDLPSDGYNLKEGTDALCVDTPLNKILFSYIKRKGMTTTEVYKAANMPKQMMSKLKWQPNYHPNKKNLCAFAIALKMNLNETKNLLSTIGYTLSENQDFDRVIIENIKKQNYDIKKIEEELYVKYNIDWTNKR